jgi:hypothetical protein
MAELHEEHWNPLPICAGLELSAPQGGDDEKGLWLNAELIFGCEPITDQEVSLRLGVKAGFLKLDLEGCAAVLQTLYAMLDQPASIARETREEERKHDTLQAQGGAGVELLADPEGVSGKAKANIGGSRGRTHERTVTSTLEGKTETRKVTARGTRSAPAWEIAEVDGKRLDGRYLGQENLCQLAADQDPHGYSATARFVCRKRDLDLDIDPGPRWPLISRNKEALALALIAKSLGRDDMDGEVELCRSKLATRVSED